MDNAEQPIHFDAPSLEELAPLFPAYELEVFVAQGGMGAVYKARQTSLDRPVAIKILPREFGQDETFRASFEAEAKAMARLNHPNLIGIYDFGNVGGMLFLVMEYVEGKSLYHSSYGKAIDPAQAAEIVIAICRALDHAHAAGILHRDIKPANILLAPNATPKIGDFGLACPMNQDADPDEIIYGTPGYTAPEVINRQPVDHRSDIFSIGVMLHELLTGALPDDHKTAASLIAQTPIAYDQIINHSTQADPALRYNSAGEFADALEKAVKSTPQTHTLPDAGTTAAAPISRPTQVATPAKKSPALAIILVLLAIGAVAAIFITSQNKQPEQPTAATPSEQPEPVTTPEKPQQPTKPVEATATAKVIPVPTPDKPKETAWAALARLKKQLASGKRTEFPDQARAHNDSHFLLIRKTFTSAEAIRFAETHGAHLAILSSPEDRHWATESLKLKTPAYIGAGLAARNQWQWMDATPWGDTKQPKALSAEENMLAITSVGTLSPQKPSAKLPIILQWRDDATNPATMDAQLTRAAESVKENGIATARYPIGTRTFQQSHFLLLPREISWESARQLAKSHSAELPVPSSPEESQWLTKTFSNKKRSIWLGGYKLDDSSPWQWITREAWHSTGWTSEEPSQDNSKNRMMMNLTSSSETKTWISTDGSKGTTSHTLLEWSKPKAVKTSTAKFDLDKWLTAVNRKIAARVSPLVEEYEKDRKKLVASYVREMKRAVKKVNVPGRGGKGKGKGNRMIERLENLVDEAMDEVKDSGELPKTIPKAAPKEFHKLTDKAKKNITKIDKKHQAALKKELDFYADGLLKKATDITKQGFTQQANQLEETIKNIGGNTSKFVKQLGL